MIGAHYDSAGFKIKGANDNASGASAVLTLAQAFKRSGIRAERTLRFMLFDGEELGFYGSMNHLAQVARRSESLELFVNLDMIAYPLTQHRSFFFDAREYLPALSDLMHAANEAMPDDLRMDPRPAPRLYRSDHHYGPYVGYPAVGLVEHVLDHQGKTLKISPNYHTTKDVIAPLDLDYAFGIVRFLATLAETAANSEQSWARSDDLQRRISYCDLFL